MRKAGQLIRSMRNAGQLLRSIRNAEQLLRSMRNAEQLLRSMRNAGQLLRSMHNAGQPLCSSGSTRFLCMHKVLVHAQHSCACTGPGNAGARDQSRGQGPGLGPKKAAGPVPGAGPLRTRVLCMHKNLVHAHKNLDIFTSFEMF